MIFVIVTKFLINHIRKAYSYGEDIEEIIGFFTVYAKAPDALD